MKNVKIKKISLSNWKGMSREIEFNEDSTIIMGCNGIGKTSIFKAFFWLLTGYTDSVHGKNHEIFDNTMPLSQHTPVASVSAVISIDGRDVEVSRSAKAKFVRKRASSEYEKAPSDEYKYLIDNIDFKLTDFNEWISNNVCPVDLLPMCINGEFFTTLAEEDRNAARYVIESTVGDVDIKCLVNYKELKDDLDFYSIEDVRTKYKNLSKPLNARMSEIISLVADKDSAIKNTVTINVDDVKKEIEKCKEELSNVDAAISGNIDSLKPLIEKRDACLYMVQEKKDALRDAKIKHEDEVELKRKDIRSSIREIKEKNEQNVALKNRLMNELDVCKKSISNNEKKRKECNEIRNALVERRNEIKSLKFDEKDAICPMCGQMLPEDKLSSAKAKFEHERSVKLEHVIAEGKRNTEEMDMASLEVDKMKKRVTEIEEELLKVCEPISYDDLEKKLSETSVRFEDTEEYYKLNEEIESIEIPEVKFENSDELSIKKTELMSRIDELNQQLGNEQFSNERVDILRNEIAELKIEARETGSKIAEYEKKLYQLKELEEEKANRLAEMVNEHLSNIYIQMFDTQKNGEKTPSCTIMSKDGVKFSTLNNSARLLATIELQRMFCDIVGVSMPVFCDECSIYDENHLPKGNGQFIYIYCSNDKNLIVK